MNSEKEKKSKENETLTLICNPIPNRVNPKRRRGREEIRNPNPLIPIGIKPEKKRNPNRFNPSTKKKNKERGVRPRPAQIRRGKERNPRSDWGRREKEGSEPEP